MNREMLVPELAVRLSGRAPESSNMRTTCSGTRHRWQNKSSVLFYELLSLLAPGHLRN